MLKVVLKGFFFGIGFAIALTFVVLILNSTDLLWSVEEGTPQTIGHLPMEEKIEVSTLIVRTVHSGNKSIIAEIVYIDPNIQFGYEIGDEYSPMGVRGASPEMAGDGKIFLHTGAPPYAVYSTSYDRKILNRYDYDVSRYLIAEGR